MGSHTQNLLGFKEYCAFKNGKAFKFPLRMEK